MKTENKAPSAWFLVVDEQGNRTTEGDELEKGVTELYRLCLERWRSRPQLAVMALGALQGRFAAMLELQGASPAYLEHVGKIARTSLVATYRNSLTLRDAECYPEGAVLTRKPDHGQA